MNQLARKLALLVSACSFSALAAAAVSAPVVSSVVNAKPVLRQALGAPVLGKDRNDPRLVKLDATLHRLYVRSGQSGASVTTLAMQKATPQARLRTDAPRKTPSVLVDITVKGNTAAAKAQLEKLELRNGSMFSNLVSGWLPVDRLVDAAALSSVRRMRASLAQTHSGIVQTEGDFVQRSDKLRASKLVPGLLGTGVTVGVISDSFNCLGGYAADVSTGDLPPDVNIISEDGSTTEDPTTCPSSAGGTDEGRAMAQVVYDVAPGSKLAFYTAFNGEADFANGILALAKAGAKVITDDVGYFDEPVFQDGIVAQAIDQVKAQGVSYFSSAGNNAQQSWEGPWIDSGVTGTAGAGNQGEELMQFKGSDGSTSNFLPIAYYPDQYYVTAVLEWDQPYSTGSPSSPGATSSMDICATDENGVVLTATDPDTGDDYQVCSGLNIVSEDSIAIVQYLTPGTEFGGLAVSVAANTLPPKNLKIIFSDDGFGTQALDPFATYSGTVQGHPGAAGAAAIGASYWRHTPVCSVSKYPKYELEAFSSSGGDAVLFDANGVRLAEPDLRQKPNFVAPDGGATTFFGSDTGPDVIGGTAPICDIPAHSFLFRGTSEAAPHAAGVAALLYQAQPNITPDQVYAALSNSAIDMTAEGVDFDSGYGFIQADAALALVTPIAALDPSALSFASQAIGTTSAKAKTATLTNNGKAALVISSISTAPDFPSSNDCPASLDPDATCTFTVSFAPTADGPLNESITIASNTPGGVTTLALSGTGTRPAFTVNPTSLVFNQVGTTSSGVTAPQTLTVTSTGDGPVAISGVSTTGEFQASSNCPDSLDEGATCTISVTMSSSLDTLSKSGTVVITSDAPAGPVTVPVSGTIKGHGGSMPFWLLLPGLAAFAARRRKKH